LTIQTSQSAQSEHKRGYQNSKTREYPCKASEGGEKVQIAKLNLALDTRFYELDMTLFLCMVQSNSISIFTTLT